MAGDIEEPLLLGELHRDAKGSRAVGDDVGRGGADIAMLEARPSCGARSFAAVVGVWQAVGLVFGDICTSPLYVFSSIFPSASDAPTPDDVVGALSLILWTLTLVATIKYSLFLMTADHRGEGGTFALMSLIEGGRRRMLSQRVVAMAAVLNLVAVGMVLGDGVLSPAMSVLSALEGIRVTADISQDAVVGLAALVIILLFLVQRAGSARIAYVFGPITLAWLVTLAVTGAMNLASAPWVLAAWNPAEGAAFVGRHGVRGLVSLGAVMLSVTGVEAMYADMGRFGRASIRLGWLLVAYPTLVLSYAGQAARLVADPSLAHSSAFFRTLPEGSIHVVLAIATAASLFAAQGLISSAFSIAHQAMQLDCLPHLLVKHTSATHRGQIYVPEVNYALMALVLLVLVTFQSSASLAPAYGLAACTVMAANTLLFSLALFAHFGWHWTLVLVAFLLPFAVVDGAFFTANLVKFTTGAWVTIAVALLLIAAMMVFRWGREQLRKRVRRLRAERDGAVPLPEEADGEDDDRFVVDDADAAVGRDSVLCADDIAVVDQQPAAATSLAAMLRAFEEARAAQQALAPLAAPAAQRRPLRVLAVVTADEDEVPAAFLRMASLMPVVFDLLLFLHVVRLRDPHAPRGRASAAATQLSTNAFQVDYAVGFADTPDDADAIVKHSLRDMLHAFRRAGEQEAADAMSMLRSNRVSITYLCGRELVAVDERGIWHRRAMLSVFKALMRLSRATPTGLSLPEHRTIEIGIRITL